MRVIPTLIQSRLDKLARANGFEKKAGSWYLRRDETILVLNLQKSNYGGRYYLNVAVWLRELGDETAPKEQNCHIRTRLGRLVVDPDVIDRLLDNEWAEIHPATDSEFVSVMSAALGPVIEGSASVEALREGAGRRLVEKSLVTGPAQRLVGS